MNETSADTHSSTDGLWRWLVGGLAGGGIILGLLIAAYAVGYHRGQHHPHGTASAAAPTAPSPPPSTATSPSGPASTLGPVTATPALVARGDTLYKTDGCVACHSLNGSAGVGTSFKGLAGSQVALSDGQTVTGDDAYLEQSIASPDAKIVKGYRSGVMSAAVSGYDLASKPNDIRALVAFIKAQK